MAGGGARVNRIALALLAAMPLAALPLAAFAAEEPLTLEALLQRARTSDLRIAAARDQIDVYEAQLREARWAWFPDFATTFHFGGPVPEAKVAPGATSPLEVTPASLEGDLDFGRMGISLRGSLQTAVPVYTFGKLSGYREAMRGLVDLGEAELERTRDEVAFDVARAYYGYQAATKSLEGLEDGMKRARKARARIEKLLAVESEQVSDEDLLKTDLLIQHLEAQAERLKVGRRVALAAIRLLAGLGEAEPVEVVRDPLDPPAAPPALDALVTRARVERPELAAVQAGIDARSAERKVRAAAYYPDFLVAGFGEFRFTTSATDQRNPFVYDPYNLYLGGVGLVMRATFDIPQKAARVARVEAEVRKLQHTDALLRRAVALEVEQAWQELTGALAEQDRLAEAERTARRWTVASLANFEIGIGTVEDVLEPIAAYAATVSSRTGAVYRASVARASLCRAVGVDLAELAE